MMIDEDLEVDFEFLVNSLGLAICLRMIGGGKGSLDVKESIEFLGESSGKLWITIRNDLMRKTLVIPNVFIEKPCRLLCRDRFVTRDQV